ncbi:ninja-family protein-like [Iris pallida]|uniref:Ninja-family protein n=1 Tax=Iris pallida TaxID=29817 RepID=A0AAX6HDP1_IRIPA|nr:ninja-family protein-like [Iris pallida]
MDDENGLELSLGLGLSCGGSSGKSKIVDVPSDLKVEAGSRSDTNASDPSFKNFFQTGSERQDSKGKEKSDPILPQNKNFWTDLAKSPASASAYARDLSNDVHNNVSQFNRYQEPWTSKNKTADSEENSNKRKMPFEEVMFQNKHGKVVDYTGAPYKNPSSGNITTNSKVSNLTENLSTGENEDIAESETEGSNSWLVSQHEDKSKCSDMSKYTDKHVLRDSRVNVSKGEKVPSVSGIEASHESGDVAYGIRSSLQPLHVNTVPYPMPIKVATTPNAPNPTGFPSPYVMQGMPVMGNERSSGQALNTSNLQLAFGYSSVQLPTLETGSSWAFNSQPRHVTSLVNKDNADGVRSSEHSGVKTSHVSAHAPGVSSPSVVYEGKSFDSVKANGKHSGEVGTSSKIQDEGKNNFSIFRPKEPTRPVAEGFSQRGLTIEPGIASEIKFGGCGSCPNLPWVSATGSGLNGRTISGVAYKFSQNQVKIVCACHGTHMSQEEFIQHASADAPKPEDRTTFLDNNPAASAKS